MFSHQFPTLNKYINISLTNHYETWGADRKNVLNHLIKENVYHVENSTFYTVNNLLLINGHKMETLNFEY